MKRFIGFICLLALLAVLSDWTPSKKQLPEKEVKTSQTNQVSESKGAAIAEAIGEIIVDALDDDD